MSLLEDVFLQDETHEAQELERVIEGDEFEDRVERDVSDDDRERGDDEAEEDKRRVDPTTAKTKRVVKNPRVVLNPARLMGPRGIQVIPDHFKDFKFKGKGREKEDLDLILKKLEHWAYRLYPKFKFEDCLKKIETLGKKRQVMVHLHKIRSDQYVTEETVTQKDSSDDEAPQDAPQEEDEFDKLLQQQIDVAHSAKKTMLGADISTPFTMPKATSSPSISEEQKERMLRNKRLAEERRLARLKMIQTAETDKENQSIEIGFDDKTTNPTNEDSNVNSQSNKSKTPEYSGQEPTKSKNSEHDNHSDSDNDEINTSKKRKPNVLSFDDSDSESEFTNKKSEGNDKISENDNDENNIKVSKKRKSNVLSFDDSDSDTETVNRKSNLSEENDNISVNDNKTENTSKKRKSNVLSFDDSDSETENANKNDNNSENDKDDKTKNMSKKRKANVLNFDDSDSDTPNGSNQNTKMIKTNFENDKTQNSQNFSDSSDEECFATTENVSINVDVHENRENNKKSDFDKLFEVETANQNSVIIDSENDNNENLVQNARNNDESSNVEMENVNS